MHDKNKIVKKISLLKRCDTQLPFSNIKKCRKIAKNELYKHNSIESSPLRGYLSKNRTYLYNKDYNEISTKEDDS